MASALVKHSIARYSSKDANKYCFSSLCNPRCTSESVRYKSCKMYPCCSLSMNGCERDPNIPLEIIQTRTFSPVSTPRIAMERLKLAILELDSNPPGYASGIIRLEVPIEEQLEAIDWLHVQNQLLPRCFFSSRRSTTETVSSNILLNGSENGKSKKEELISVAGVGAAVLFHHSNRQFSLDDWKCIKRFLSEDCPLIRAYGAIRFDPTTSISFEWERFGSFYFVVPLVEFDEFEGSSILSVTISWDNTLSWTWRSAVDMLQTTMSQISSNNITSKREVPNTFILSNTNVPNKESWDIAVSKALQMINKSSSDLIKVVLARSSRVITKTDIDPIAWLSYLKVEGQNAYQFCIQPSNGPAFIGNTPEQLFHRKHLSISSEALAGTRARGRSKALDDQIGNDLLFSLKDHLEFTIVRESIQRKLEEICSFISVEPKKSIRKLPRVQHLYAQLSGRLKNEDDEFDILSSLHPSPAVCGFPTEVARRFIADTEMFDRGMYAGPVGWFGGRESEFAVGIRSALVEKGLGALIYAGAGIVLGTDPSLEWDELELKTSQFTKLMESERSCSSCQEVDIGTMN